MGLLWIFVLLGAVAGGVTALSAFVATSAPQQAAAAAIGISLAVIPYCIARACQFLGQDAKLIELRALNEAMGIHTRLLAASANALNPITEPKLAVDQKPGLCQYCGIATLGKTCLACAEKIATTATGSV